MVCTLEGTRPLLAEVQALLAESPLAYPRRVTVGFDSGRLAVLLAVVETSLGAALGRADVYVQVTGGLSVAEPAADLGVIAAIASRRLDRPLAEETVFIGEVGLSGEVRRVHQARERLREAARLGFRRAILNPDGLGRGSRPEGLRITAVKTLAAALEAAW